MRKVYGPDLGANAFTSIWIPKRLNATLVRCTQCGRMADYEKANGVCACGQALPSPLRSGKASVHRGQEARHHSADAETTGAEAADCRMLVCSPAMDSLLLGKALRNFRVTGLDQAEQYDFKGALPAMRRFGVGLKTSSSRASVIGVEPALESGS